MWKCTWPIKMILILILILILMSLGSLLEHRPDISRQEDSEPGDEQRRAAGLRDGASLHCRFPHRRSQRPQLAIYCTFQLRGLLTLFISTVTKITIAMHICRRREKVKKGVMIVAEMKSGGAEVSLGLTE